MNLYKGPRKGRSSRRAPKFEPDPDAFTRFVPGVWRSHRGAQDKERHQREPIMCPSRFQVIVVRDDRVPRLSPVSREVLRQPAKR